MDRKTALEKFEQGERLIVCEFRSSKVEQINWRDKTTGRALSATVLRHVVEMGADSVVVNERTPEDFDGAKWQPPFKKGDKVVLHFTEFRTEKGMISTRGALELLTD